MTKCITILYEFRFCTCREEHKVLSVLEATRIDQLLLSTSTAGAGNLSFTDGQISLWTPLVGNAVTYNLLLLSNNAKSPSKARVMGYFYFWVTDGHALSVDLLKRCTCCPTDNRPSATLMDVVAFKAWVLELWGVCTKINHQLFVCSWDPISSTQAIHSNISVPENKFMLKCKKVKFKITKESIYLWTSFRFVTLSVSKLRSC